MLNNNHHLCLTALLALLLFIPACQKPARDNPWDEKANLNPNDWAPQNFQVEDVSPVEKKITWTYDDKSIEGFKLDRKKGEESWQVAYQTFAKETRSWNDTDIVPDPALTYSYRLYTYAGKNVSGEKTTTASAEFPAPTNLIVTRNSITSVTLNWQSNSTGEQGFHIERKQGTANWEMLATITGISYIDEAFELNTDVSYRVAAYHGQYVSDYVESSFDSQIPAPTNLQITQNSITSATLNWSYNLTGLEGFKLDRKTNEGEWNTIAPNINPEVLSFTDNQINLEQNNYSYRLSAFAQNTFSDHSIINILGAPCAGVNPPPGYGVVSSSGKCWLDRNLGASRVAQSSTDADAYGDLYQWGRLTDGHEKRTSGTTNTLSSSNTPGHGNFILAPNSPYDWRSPQNNNLWQGVSGTNNPCPSGYRLPTEAEWEAERQTWSSNNAAGAFNSPLKLPVAGDRVGSNGSLDAVGSYGGYWSATVGGTRARGLSFNSSGAGMSSSSRAYGVSVRCLKE